MMKSEDKQISLTDPDARSMATSGKDTGIVGYNVQIAVDKRQYRVAMERVPATADLRQVRPQSRAGFTMTYPKLGGLD